MKCTDCIHNNVCELKRNHYCGGEPVSEFKHRRPPLLSTGYLTSGTTDKMYIPERMYALRCIAGEDNLSCANCAYKSLDFFKCHEQAVKDVVNLIESQKTEIEALKIQIKNLEYCFAHAKKYNDLTERNQSNII